MKKLFLLSLVTVALIGCTTQAEDRAILQKKYKIVYDLSDETNRYICIDTAMNVYDVRMDSNGKPYGIFRINQ